MVRRVWCGGKNQFRGLGQAGFMAFKRHLRASSEVKYRIDCSNSWSVGLLPDLQVISPKQIEQSSTPCLIFLYWGLYYPVTVFQHLKQRVCFCLDILVWEKLHWHVFARWLSEGALSLL